MCSHCRAVHVYTATEGDTYLFKVRNTGLYVMEKDDYDRLVNVMRRLYDGTKLDFDKRRDLARSMDYVIGNVETVDKLPVQ